MWNFSKWKQDHGVGILGWGGMANSPLGSVCFRIRDTHSGASCWMGSEFPVTREFKRMGDHYQRTLKDVSEYTFNLKY